MRYLAATAVMLFAAQFASARGEPPNAAAPQPPSVSANPQPAKTTEELKKRVEEVGFKDVEVVPRMFVVLAKKPDGQSVSMIVDADTLQALQLGADGPDQGGSEEPAAPEGACKGPAQGQPL